MSTSRKLPSRTKSRSSRASRSTRASITLRSPPIGCVDASTEALARWKRSRTLSASPISSPCASSDLAGQRRAVARGRVGAAAVVQEHALALADDLGVQARDVRVDEHHVAVGLTADPDPRALQREARALQVERAAHDLEVSPAVAAQTHDGGLVGARLEPDDLGLGFQRRGGAHLEQDPPDRDAVPGREQPALDGLPVHQGRIRRGSQVLERPAVGAREQPRLARGYGSVAQHQPVAARAGLVAPTELGVEVAETQLGARVGAFEHDQRQAGAAASGRGVVARIASRALVEPGHRWAESRLRQRPRSSA